MTESNRDLVIELFQPWIQGGEIAASLESDEFLETARRLLAPEAPITFATPDGGFVGAMRGPFNGVEGFVAGWSEWLEPWDEFRVEFDEMLDGDEGRVLVLAKSTARLKGGGSSVVQDVAAVYQVEGDRIVRIDHFLDQAQARRSAGLE